MERIIAKLLKESPRRFRDLRSSCETFTAGNRNNPSAVSTPAFIISVLEILLKACETRHPRLMEIGLDALHNLIEHRHLDDGIFAEGPITISTVIEVVCRCSEEYDDGVQVQVIKTLLVAVTSASFSVHEANLLLAVRACFQIHLTSKNVVVKTTAKAALTQMISAVFQRMEAEEGIKAPALVAAPNSPDAEASMEEPSSPDGSSITDSTVVGGNGDLPASDATIIAENGNLGEGIENIYQKDAYLLFRALCKLSMKGVADDSATSNDAIIHQNKLLSLELIFVLMRGSGPAFRASVRFIAAIRTFLCNSLLSNCTSPDAEVVGFALQIFLLLVQEFKEHLKAEVEVFISSVFLRIIESENSPFDHKLRVLQVLHLLCSDAKAQLELFVNYDCDFDASNLFSRIVESLSRIAKSTGTTPVSKLPVEFISSATKRTQSEEFQIRMLGLEGLVTMLRSLVSLCAGRADNNNGNNNSNNNINNGIEEEKTMTIVTTVDDQLQHQSSIEQINISFDSVSMENNVFGVENFDRKLRMERSFETGILKFQLSPLKGLKFLASEGILPSFDPPTIARFLLENADRLDKTSVGDFLGREREYENGLCIAVLDEYVKLLDFSELEFDLAIRLFLSGFRLPGEAQKIDRIMEKFAEKYFLQHSDQFISADLAFILAFSTIMLQTNLHNPAIKDDKRMTKEQFFRQNKNISPEGELSEDLLSRIYDRIAAEPISLSDNNSNGKSRLRKEESVSSSSSFGFSQDRRKRDAFATERREMVRQSEALMKMKKTRASVFIRNVTASEESYMSYTRSMFEVMWPAILGVISLIVDSEDDSRLIELSIAAFESAIILSCRLDFPVARNTFINALAKFTTLDTIREMKVKSIQCIKLLLALAVTHGDSLEEGWHPILMCVSQLARLQLFSTSSQAEDVFLNESEHNSNNDRRRSRTISDRSSSYSGYSDPVTKFFLGPTKAETSRQIEESNAEIVSRFIDPAVIDKIFISSTKLSGSSVLHFVRSLCMVSAAELSLVAKTVRAVDNDNVSLRIFCLQKLVEVADYNMNSRSRVDWTNMWSLLARHFTTTGLHENGAVSMYAIDSLKQLSIKFLQKAELTNFNFQRLFLRPFEMIMSKSSSIEIKDLVLRCIDIMIKACAPNIRSGWKTIFAIIELGASQEITDIARLAFTLVDGLIREVLSVIVQDFVELLNCLVAFACSRHTALAIRAIAHLRRCGQFLADGLVVQVPSDIDIVSTDNSLRDESRMSQRSDDSSVFRLWWPLLLGLSARVGDFRQAVRLEALQTLENILQDFGLVFSPQAWAMILRGILYPMMDSARALGEGEGSPALEEKFQWVESMAERVMIFCVNIYCQKKELEDTTPLLPELLNMLRACATVHVLTLSNAAFMAMRNLCLRLSSTEMLTPNIRHQPQMSKQHSELFAETIKKTTAEILTTTFVSKEKICLLLKNCPDSVLFQILHLDKVMEEVMTPYGKGKLVEVVGKDSSAEVRHKIQLRWGLLYTINAGVSLQARGSFARPSRNRLCIIQNGLSQIVHLVDELLIFYQLSFSDYDMNKLLDCVEMVHWYAYLYNQVSEVPVQQQQSSSRNNKVANPIDLFGVEVGAMECLLRWSLAIYKVQPRLNDLIGNRLSRYAIAFAERCMGEFEDENKSDASDEEPILSSINHRKQLYENGVIIFLNSLLELSSDQFQSLCSWVPQLMSSLILCRSQHIRYALQRVYEHHIDPRLRLCTQLA